MFVTFRWDITYQCNLRSLESLKFCSSKTKKENLGVLHEPLFNIELSHVIIDELHLFLKVLDILIRNIIWAAVAIDHQIKVHHQEETNQLSQIVEAIQSCGISFKVINPL